MKNIAKSNRLNWVMFIGVLLVGANLRAPITSIGVALPDIKHDLMLSNSVASIITVVPLLAFAVVSLFAARMGSRIGLEQTVFYALLLILSGIMVRAITDVSWLFVGTILIGVGIAFGNVLAPAIIKANFPLHIGIMTGYYTVVMNVFGSVSTYVTAPLIKVMNYPLAISVIGIITILTIIIWSLQLSRRPHHVPAMQETQVNVWKSPLAWQITMLMGGQSLLFYSLINWMPVYLSSNGMAIDEASMYLSIMQLAIIPFTFITPIFAAKMKSQFLLTLITGLLFVIGVLILMTVPSLSLISTILIGIASGVAFGLVNTFFSMRTEQGTTAAKLSGMSQSVGYLFAAFGPLGFGVLHDLTHSWTSSFAILLITAVMITIIGSQAGRNRTIEQSLRS